MARSGGGGSVPRRGARSPEEPVAEAACPLRGQLDSRRRLAAIKDHALHAAIPVARAPVRYGPRRASARLWRDKVEPYLAWHSHRFTARTVFGARMHGDTR